MYCPRCGAQNADDAAQCAQCGTSLQASAQPPEQQEQPQQPQQPQQPPPEPPQAPFDQPQPQPPYGQMPPQAPFGQSPFGQPAGTPPNLTLNWVLSIFGTVCCGCLPLGILSIVYTAQANTKVSQGDYPGAQELSKKSLTFALISIGVGVVLGGIWFVLNMLSAVAHPRTFGAGGF